jgi:hypothetical protein
VHPAALATSLPISVSLSAVAINALRPPGNLQDAIPSAIRCALSQRCSSWTTSAAFCPYRSGLELPPVSVTISAHARRSASASGRVSSACTMLMLMDLPHAPDLSTPFGYAPRARRNRTRPARMNRHGALVSLSYCLA